MICSHSRPSHAIARRKAHTSSHGLPGSQTEPAGADDTSEENACPPYDLAAIRREVARQDDITRSLSAAEDGALRGTAQPHVRRLCRTLDLGDHDAGNAAKVRPCPVCLCFPRNCLMSASDAANADCATHYWVLL